MNEEYYQNPGKILVTGVSGTIGKKTVEHLLKKGVPANQIIGLSRKKETAIDLVGKGIAIRLGDYFDLDSLKRAFEGVDKVMLTSSVAFTDRFTQHKNVVTAAAQSGVKHVVYMAIMRKEGSGYIIPEVTESDLLTESLIKSSGLNYTILYHPPFMDLLSLYFDADPFKNGIKVPANNGKMAPVIREELAEAHASVLATPGHENKTYSLGGSKSISFSDIAKILSKVKGKPVPFSKISTEEYIDKIVSNGVSHQVAEFITGWMLAIEQGEFEDYSGDLERLLGRKSTTFRSYIESTMH